MPCDNKNTFLFWKWNSCLIFHSSPAIRLRFLVAILENGKNLSGNCLGTNLESLESLNNIYPRPFHSVVWKEKKLTHKSSPPVKIGSPFIIVNSTWFPKSWHNPSGGGGGTQQVLYGEAPAPTFNPLPLYKLFFTRKVPFSFTLFWQMVPLSFTKFIRTFHPF